MSRDNPHHPGETLLEDCIKALDLTITEAAEHLQVSEADLTAICECRAPVSGKEQVVFRFVTESGGAYAR